MMIDILGCIGCLSFMAAGGVLFSDWLDIVIVDGVGEENV